MANWLQFDRIGKWNFSLIDGFAYDNISDALIKQALSDHENLNNVDCNIEWEYDRWLVNNPHIPNDNKHAYRVASLVSAMQNGYLLEFAINLDTYSNGNCCSCVCDGHHRIRALQYLGLTAGPFSLSGLVTELESLLSIAGVDPPLDASRFVSDKLIQIDSDDLKKPLVRKQKLL